METGVILDVIRLIIGITILSYASYTDIKIRRASNMLWVIMGSIGAILLVIQYFTIGFDNIWYLLFIPIFIGIVYVLFQLRLLYGGADAKAFMALAVLVPLQPEILQFPLLENSLIVLPGSLIIFLSAILLSLFIPLSLFLYNLSKKNVKFPHSFLGYKMSLQKALTVPQARADW